MTAHSSIAMQRGSFKQGTYRLRAAHPAGPQVKGFIEQRQFLDLKPVRVIPLRNRSNKLYEILLPGSSVPLYLKIIWCNPECSWPRRLNYRVRQLFRDNAFKAFRGSLAMETAGLETLQAVACWRSARSFMTWDSYFLYQPVKAAGSVKDLYEDWKAHPDEERRAVLEQALDRVAPYLRQLFAHKLRHYDLALGNWLVTESGVALIDTDSVVQARVTIPVFKTFFDLACFKRLNLSPDHERRVLQQCLGDTYREAWWKVHRFWRFGLWRRLRGKKPRVSA